MTTNDMDAEAVVLGQTYFALDAGGFAALQGLVDNPPSATVGLLRTLTNQAPWHATAAAVDKSTPAQ